MSRNVDPNSPGPRTCLSRAAALRLCAGTAAAFTLGAPGAALAVDWSWVSPSSGNWNTASNWFPASVPAPGGSVFIGNVAGVQNDTVDLNTSATIGFLTITDGMTLDTNSLSLTVTGDTVISGENHVPLTGGGNVVYSSDIAVRPVDGTSFITDDLTLSSGGRFRLYGGYSDIGGLYIIGEDCAQYGYGVVDFTSAGITLRNNGLIQVAMSNQPTDLHMRQFGGGTYNLDGTTEDGRIHMATMQTETLDTPSIRLDGVGLSDAFSGEFSFASGGDVFMNLTNGWSVDAPGRLNCYGFSELAGEPAVIRGGPLTFGGQLTVLGMNSALLHIDSEEVTFTSTAQVHLNQHTDAKIGIQGGDTVVTILGGTYDIENGADLRFDGETIVRGGVFNMMMDTEDEPAVPAGTGRVIFGGGGGGHPPTQWAAPGSGGQPVTVNGVLRQEGTASVTGSTTLNVHRFDMDGYGGGLGQITTWSIFSSLVVNAGDLQSDGSNFLNTNITIYSDLFARLTMNVGEDGLDQWYFNGNLGIYGHPSLFVTRLAGAPVSFSSNAWLSGGPGRAHIAAPVTLLGGSLTSLSDPTAQLRFGPRLLVVEGAEFQGDGTIVIGGPGGTLGSGDAVFRNGVTLNDLGLRNEGVVTLGNDALHTQAAAAVSMDRYESTAGSRWRVSVGGPLAGSGHDVLIVSGAGGVSPNSGVAQLAGTLDVELVRGTGSISLDVFRPQVGDTFTILTALDGVTGTFFGNPSTFVPAAAGGGLGLTYQWTVLYGTNDVRIRLDGITNSCLADFNNSGLVTTQDIYDFLTDWASQSVGGPNIIKSADFNGSGGVTTQDIYDFLTAWYEGCQ